MRTFIVFIGSVIVLVFALVLLVSDRDRSMWVLNTAVKMANPHPLIHDIQYGAEPWQKLDIYPAQASNDAPVIIFVYGGSWRHGRKDQYRFAADAFIRKGYTVVIPDYIKYPDSNARFPSFARDVASAVAWVKNNITNHNGDRNNLFLAGHSAGAHTVAILTADQQYLTSVGLTESDIRGVAGIAGPYSFTPDWEVTKAVFGPESRYPLMDVFNYIDGSEPSTILLHSESDTQVGRYNTDGLHERMIAKGVDVKKVIYKQPSHIDMVTMLHPWFTKADDVAQDIDTFFRERIR